MCRIHSSSRLKPCQAFSRGACTQRGSVRTPLGPLQPGTIDSQRPFRCSISEGCHSKQSRGVKNHIWHDTRCLSASAAPTTSASSASSSPESIQLDQDLQEPQEQVSISLPISAYERPPEQTYTKPSMRETGTLKPAAEWYPAWMRYRKREDNYIFWREKFERCSLDIPWIEKRWTLFSSLWFLVMETKFIGIPPALRYLFFLGWRQAMLKVYEAHKLLVLWQCKVDSAIATVGRGKPTAFSMTMALRRLHWKNTMLAELLYTLNLYKTGRIHLLPPVKQPFQRPTFFFLF